MSRSEKSLVIRCDGHPNISASHAKTFELTRDPSVTQAGTCIIGVNAQYDEAALLALRGAVEVEMRCGDFCDRVVARINPKFTAGAPLIFRRMPTPEPRTFAVGSDKGASLLDRDLIKALKLPGAKLEVSISKADFDTKDSRGLLYLVGMPIGNQDDLSPRALSVLQSVDLVLCEDTRTTKALLAGFGLDVPTTAYHDHNERDRVADLIQRLQKGNRLALVSEAGMPLISDPGFHLVRAARDADIPVTAVPGPDAVTTALGMSGLPTDDFRFVGFLPRKAGQRREVLIGLSDVPYTAVFFESPHRIDKTLAEVAELFGTRPLALCRNLTKFGEKVLRGTADEVLAQISNGEAVNGELVLVITGAPPKDEASTGTVSLDTEVLDRMLGHLVEAGLPTKALGDALAYAMGMKRRDGFNHVLALKKGREEE